MSMSVDVSVNGDLIRRLNIRNVTGRPTGSNTYRWIYTDHANGAVRGLMSAQQGEVEHVMEDGVMVLLSKVAEAAAATESAVGS